jgi:ubiquinone/menaquinone biosynthesis C-methylase UbiE
MMQNHNLTFNDSYFSKHFPFDPRRDVIWKEVCRFLQKKYILETSTILDAGAGYCNFINNIQGKEKHAIDVYSRFVQYANSDVTVHVQSCTNLDFIKDNYFDVVFASNLLEHLTREEISQTLYEFHRILTDEGRLIVLQPNFKYCYKSYFDDYTHLQVFTDKSLSEVLEAHNLSIIDVKPRLLPVNMKSTLWFPLPKLHLFTRLYLHFPIRPLAAQMLIIAEK